MKLIIDIPEQMYLNAKADLLCGGAILVEAIKNGIPYEERPQGEWKDLSDGWQEGTYECSNCKSEFVLTEGTPEDNEYHFCPNCGASMKKGGAE